MGLEASALTATYRRRPQNVHNHPSGDPSPSAEDLALPKRLCEVGELVGIRVLDHIVLGEAGAFRSLADEGLLGGGR